MTLSAAPSGATLTCYGFGNVSVRNRPSLEERTQVGMLGVGCNCPIVLQEAIQGRTHERQSDYKGFKK